MRRLVRIAAAAVLAAMVALGAGTLALAEEQQQSDPVFKISINGGEAQDAVGEACWIVPNFDRANATIEVVSVDGKAVTGITNKPQPGKELAPLETSITKIADGVWSFGFKYHPGDDAVNSGIPEVDMPATMTIKSSANAELVAPSLDKPKTVKLTGQSKAIKVSWTTVNDAKGYTVYYSTSKKGVAKGKTVKVAAGKSSVTIKKLAGKKTYYVSVQATGTYADHLGNTVKISSKLTTPKKVTTKK